MALLEVRRLGVDYRTRQGPAHALEDVSFSLPESRVLGVVGESGCGKTTMAMALMGLLPETATVSGDVELDGRNISHLTPRQWQQVRGRHVAMVFQGAMNAWNPVYTVGDQIVETILTHEPNLRRSEARARVAELYASVGLAADRADEYPHQYSGGMKQRAVIAMALACGPKLVIADEPTTALDVIVQDRILRELRRIQRERQLSMIYISHDVAVIAEMADEVAVMYAGRIIEMGPATEVFVRPVHPYTAALLMASPSLKGPKSALRGLDGGPPSLIDPPPGCRFAPRCARATTECSNLVPPFAAHRNGVFAACWHPLAEDSALPAAAESAMVSIDTSSRAPVLRAEAVTKTFAVRSGVLRRTTKVVRAVDDVTLEIGAGEVFGLVGESGSGKTTLGRMLVQLTDPTDGRLLVEVGGTPSPLGSLDRRSLRRHVQMIFQDPYESLNPRMTIGDIITEPLEVLKIGEAGERRARVSRMLERVGLLPAESFIHRYPHELSGGQRQRVAIARATVVEPRFIVADEPTSMLDVSVRAGVLNLLLEFTRELDLACLYITHDLAVARYLCDRLAVMYQGKVVEMGLTEDVLNHPQHPYTRALIDAVPIPDPTYRRPMPDIRASASTVPEVGGACRFLPRCPHATDRCRANPHPALVTMDGDHLVACYEVGGSPTTPLLPIPVR